MEHEQIASQRQLANGTGISTVTMPGADDPHGAQEGSACSERQVRAQLL